MSTTLQIQSVLAVLSPELLDMDISKIHQESLTNPQRKVSLALLSHLLSVSLALLFHLVSFSLALLSHLRSFSLALLFHLVSFSLALLSHLRSVSLALLFHLLSGSLALWLTMMRSKEFKTSRSILMLIL